MSIRISEEHLAAIHCKAKQADMTFTDYVTKACLGRQIIIDGLDDMLRQQKAIGRNLNQLTMLCNMGRVSVAILAEMKEQSQKVKQMSSREYRAAERGESWKMQLIVTIEDAMAIAGSREHFIRFMEAEGYGVKWTDDRKYITYTTPDGNKCRDIKLHEEKFLKENMEYEFRIWKLFRVIPI